MFKLARFLKPYKKQVIAGPIFKLIEAVFELIEMCIRDRAWVMLPIPKEEKIQATENRPAKKRL